MIRTFFLLSVLLVGFPIETLVTAPMALPKTDTPEVTPETTPEPVPQVTVEFRLLQGPSLPLRLEDAALALIAFPWKELKYEIVFMGPQRGYRAMTVSRERRIEIYVRPTDNPQDLAYDIAHELGHAIDLTHNTSASRKKWMEARGIDPKTRWFSCNRCSDYNSPSGDFAETFAYMLLGPGNFRGRIMPPPSPDQFEKLAPFFPKGFIAHPAVIAPPQTIATAN